MKDAIAIIPARGGSKRIPRKNIKEFCGYPIIKYSIQAAIASECFDEVMVSTDDDEIAEIALKYGAKVPFMRSNENSADKSSTAEALIEVIEVYKNMGKTFQYGCCLYPAAPFITKENLRKGYDIITNTDADSSFPVAKFTHHIEKAFIIENDQLIMKHPENKNLMNQTLSPTYHDSAQFYWFKTDRLLKEHHLITDNVRPIVLSQLEVQDIDDEDDWKIAEVKYNVIKKLNYEHKI